MGELRENWLTEGLIDFEYKKYILLSYLSKVKSAFNKAELYPFLSDLVAHYRNLLSIKENGSLITDASVLEEYATIKELEAIISFAIPEFKSSLDDGAQIYEFVESNCEISPIGLTSLYAHEGYVFLSQPPDTETNVYRYQLTVFEQSNESMRGLHMQHVRTTTRSLSNTYEHIKLQLIREFASLPNPAVYLITSKLKFPYMPTLVPVAKRLLLKKIAA
ncbi:MAG: hypothetical protein WDO14_23495 [Bacteroidota bacterium]